MVALLFFHVVEAFFRRRVSGVCCLKLLYLISEALSVVTCS